MEISSIVNYWFIIIKMRTYFNSSYMAMGSLTYIQGFFVNFFFQSIYTDKQLRHILIKNHI
jgi:hypothetical protein